jgi:hypothetical protein
MSKYGLFQNDIFPISERSTINVLSRDRQSFQDISETGQRVYINDITCITFLCLASHRMMLTHVLYVRAFLTAVLDTHCQNVQH